jgi:two-component system chemotaxis response regulator CheY
MPQAARPVAPPIMAEPETEAPPMAKAYVPPPIVAEAESAVPSMAPTQPQPPAPVFAAPAPAMGRSALIVDDSRMIRRVSRQILEQLGYIVHEAENGQEALARCKAAMPDAILLDWNMPVMTGLEFVAALRATAGGSHPRVVFCTTNSGEPAIQEALAGGADGYVVKPFTAQALEAQLKRIRAS